MVKKQVLAGLLVAVLGSVSAQASTVSQTVEYNGFSYELELSSGNFASNSTLLQDQPWWGDSSLAGELALRLGDAFGTNFGTQPIYGPAFAYQIGGRNNDIAYTKTVRSFDTSQLSTYLEYLTQSSPPGTRYVVASSVTEVPPVPLPASVAFLLAGMVGLGAISRRRAPVDA